MGFHPIYYITTVCPTLERSLDMMEQYIAHGAVALQVDLPSRNPIYETPFVQEMMAKALAAHENYDVFLNALRQLKQKHPALALHMVVYPDVIATIGLDEFAAFYQQAGLSSVMLAAFDSTLDAALQARGLTVIHSFGRQLDEASLQAAAVSTPQDIYVLVYRSNEAPERPDPRTFQEKLASIRASGIQAQIYAVEGIKTKEMMEEIKIAGADGALVGNVLMRLWDDETALWNQFDTFQAFVEN